MNTFRGIALDVWVTIDGDCPMSHEVSKTEAQLELGHNTGSLHLVMNQEGLAKLVEVAGGALGEMRAAAGKEKLGSKIGSLTKE